MDHAQKYTLEYLNILAERLQLENIEEGDPVFFPDRISELTIDYLRIQLNSLFNSTTRQNAIDDIHAFQRNTNKIQTTAIGFAKDFEQLVKLGFLLGDRIVLWDNVIHNCIYGSRINLQTLGTLASQFIRLKKIAEKGSLVILPHPLRWLDRTEDYYRSLRNLSGISTSFWGLLNAKSLLDEGFKIHPYTLDSESKDFNALFSSIVGEANLFQYEKTNYQKTIGSLFTIDDFYYLKKADANSFFNAIERAKNNSDQDINEELMELFAPPKTGLSEIEEDRFYESKIESLKSLINKKNRSIYKSVSQTGAALGVVSSMIAFYNDFADAAGILSLISGGLAISSSLIPSINEKIFNKTDEPNFIQIYKFVEEEYEQQYLNRLYNKYIV